MKARRLLFSCLALSLAACGGAGDKRDSEPRQQPPATLDLRHGSFGGVALDDTVQEMRATFGGKAPAAEGEPATALDIGTDQDYSPTVLAPANGGPPAAVLAYRYERVAFIVGGSRIEAIIVNDPSARVRGTDFGIGDELARAREHYDLKCGTANEGTEYEPFPACLGRTAPGVYIWFGGDPIRNITLSSARPDGV